MAKGDKVASLMPKWAEMNLYVKDRKEVVNVYIASVIHYRLTVVPCLHFIAKQARVLSLLLLMEGKGTAF